MNWKFWQKKPIDPNAKPKSKSREWVDAIVFAVVAATIIRTLTFEAFTIPTPSMEKSLLVGDFLLVSKFHYGARMPITPLAVPFAHHSLPVTGGKAYLEWIKLPYYRLPGISEVKRFDCVVFNYPMEDFRPIDKQENYIKRCIGMPGDTLSVNNTIVLINGSAIETPAEGEATYTLKTDGTGFNQKALEKRNIRELQPTSAEGDYIMNGTVKMADDLKEFINVKALGKNIYPATFNEPGIYPSSGESKRWNRDNFGPLYIPKAGAVLKIDTSNIDLYARVIEKYEGNTLAINGATITINGSIATSYTFKQNYYFMMGDNRHNSADSRYWGFVPETNVVGKAVFIWLSWDSEANLFNKIRWSRLFSIVK